MGKYLFVLTCLLISFCGVSSVICDDGGQRSKPIQQEILNRRDAKTTQKLQLEEHPLKEANSNKTTDNAAPKNILQALAGVSGLAALFFLFWQNIVLQKQAKALNQSIRSATYQNIVSLYIDINKTLATDNAVSEAFASFETEDTKYSLEAERKRQWLAFWLLNHYENAYTQYNMGSLPESLWLGIKEDCRTQLHKPYLIDLWNKSNAVFSPQFRHFVINELKIQVLSS